MAALCAVASAGAYGNGYENSGNHLVHAQQQFQHLGTYVGKHHLPPKEIRITKTVAVKVPVPYAVKVPHAVPYPVHVVKHVPVPVTKIVKVHEQVPVAIPKPYPVPVYKHEQAEQSASYSAPVQQHLHEQVDNQAQYNYYKETGKYTSPVFDISAFHPSVLSKGHNNNYQNIYQEGVGQQQSYGHGVAEDHSQQVGHSSLAQQIQAIQSQGYGGHQQIQSGAQEAVQPHATYLPAAHSTPATHSNAAALSSHILQQFEQHSQIGEAQKAQPVSYATSQYSVGGGQEQLEQSAGHGEELSQYGSAASAGQEQAYNQKELQQYYESAASNGEHQAQSQEQIGYSHQAEQQQPHQQQFEASPASQSKEQTSQIPAHTYSYFRLGNDGAHGASSTQQSSEQPQQEQHQYGQQNEQFAEYYKQQAQQQQYQQSQATPTHQNQEQQGHYQQQLPTFEKQVQTLKSQETPGFNHNIGQSVLKEVQGPQLGGHGQEHSPRPVYLPPNLSHNYSLKSRPIYLPPTTHSHGHYRSKY